jgi:hypothetical protein
MLKTHSNFLGLGKGARLTVMQVDLLSRLVSYLNNPRTRRDKRIVGLLERFLDLERIGREQIERRQKIQKIEGLRSELNRNLQKERFRVSLFSVFDSEWTTSRWGLSRFAGGSEADRPEEASALVTFLALAWSDHLNQLRRCPYCQKWLYARYKRQIFCSTKCQQKRYTDTDKFKRHRREYMRDYYRRSLWK